MSGFAPACIANLPIASTSGAFPVGSLIRLAGGDRPQDLCGQQPTDNDPGPGVEDQGPRDHYSEPSRSTRSFEFE